MERVRALFLLAPLFVVPWLTGAVSAREIVVAPSGGDHASVAAGISAAQAGDTVAVRSGVYYTIHFDLPGDAEPGEIEILDGAGRLVASVGAGPRPEWDGLDRNGLQAPPGIYFARVRGSPSNHVRVALVR